MTELLRHLAPLSDRAWKELEDAAREVLSLHMAARRVIDVAGPHGFAHSALDLGRVEVLKGAPSGAVMRRRRVRPLIELRVPFDLSRVELEALERGAGDAELAPLVDAARLFAAAEDTALFEGYAAGEVPGLVAGSDHDPVVLPDDPAHMPDAVAQALERLRQAGVAGPYAMALGPDAWATLHGGAGEGGYPVLSHVRRLLDGPLVWAPSLRGGVVVSLRGGDFRLVLGRDASLGYLGHDDVRVRLFLEESFQAELLGPEAAVALVPPGAARDRSRAASASARPARAGRGRRRRKAA